MNPCAGSHPIDLATLVAYWLGEMGDTATQAIDQHLLGCDFCGAQVDELAALADGVHRAFRCGRVGVFVDPGFVERLAGRGMRIREYRLPPNGSVNCGVAPDDDLLVSRFQAPLAGLIRVDALMRFSFSDEEQRFDDVPFDAARGEVVWVPNLAQVRRLPRHRMQLQLVAPEGATERIVGSYTFDHSPWATPVPNAPRRRAAP